MGNKKAIDCCDGLRCARNVRREHKQSTPMNSIYTLQAWTNLASNKVYLTSFTTDVRIGEIDGRLLRGQ